MTWRPPSPMKVLAARIVCIRSGSGSYSTRNLPFGKYKGYSNMATFRADIVWLVYLGRVRVSSDSLWRDAQFCIHMNLWTATKNLLYMAKSRTYWPSSVCASFQSSACLNVSKKLRIYYVKFLVLGFMDTSSENSDSSLHCINEKHIWI
jgi:hypothetical protein